MHTLLINLSMPPRQSGPSPISFERFVVDDQVCRRCNSSYRQPFHGVSVVEGPGRNNEDEDGGGANQADVNGELDVLKEVADNEGNGLGTELGGLFGNLTDRERSQLTPTSDKATLTRSSTSFWPSKSFGSR
jgi:hypothetical protein